MNKHIVFTQGNKGGTGKTTVLSTLIDWYRYYEIPIETVDFDSENRNNAGLSFFHKDAGKIDVRMREGLDAFFKIADETEAAVIVVDMGAGFGRQTSDWFNAAYEDCSAQGITFTSIGVITDDPGSVAGLLAWAQFLKDRVKYLVVLNEQYSEQSDFSFWKDTTEADQFRKIASPEIIRFLSINPELQQNLRNYGESLYRVAKRLTDIRELQGTINAVRANRVTRAAFAEFDRVKSVLLPTINEQSDNKTNVRR